MKPIFFKGAAAIAFISAIHHIQRGSSELSAAWSVLPTIPRRAAITGWSYMSVSYVLMSEYHHHRIRVIINTKFLMTSSHEYQMGPEWGAPWLGRI
jgi:hypothetical protein